MWVQGRQERVTIGIDYSNFVCGSTTCDVEWNAQFCHPVANLLGVLGAYKVWDWFPPVWDAMFCLEDKKKTCWEAIFCVAMVWSHGWKSSRKELLRSSGRLIFGCLDGPAPQQFILAHLREGEVPSRPEHANPFEGLQEWDDLVFRQQNAFTLESLIPLV